MSLTLRMAAQSGLINEVRAFLEAGHDPNGGERLPGIDVYPLTSAIHNGHLAIASLLLKHGATPSGALVYLCNRWTEIRATEQDKLHLARELIDRGANASQPDQFGNTPLHCACLAKCKELVELLLDHRADVDASKNGSRPLHVAAGVGDVAIIRLLLARRPDVNAKFDGRTPRDIARKAGNQKADQVLEQAGGKKAGWFG